MNRPECFDFAMDFLGEPESDEVLDYVEKLEAALKYAAEEADMGGSREMPDWIEALGV